MAFFWQNPSRCSNPHAETGYWTVIVPSVPPEERTEWHPDRRGGSFDPLNRGAFATEREAINWARAHLGGAPYTLRYVPAGES